MSYVIQNIFNENSLLQFTPRTKMYFFFKNSQIFYFFLLQNFFYLFLKKNFYFLNQYKFFFISFFFFNQTFKILKKINLSLLSFYDNRLTKSYIFWFYKTLIKSFKNNFFNNSFLELSIYFSFNNHLLSIKFFNTNLSNLFFKNIFFNLLLINSFLFFNNNVFITYLKNSLNIVEDVSIYPFYNGYFFNVYRI